MAQKSKIVSRMKPVGTEVQENNAGELLDFDAEANWQLSNELSNASPASPTSEQNDIQHHAPATTMGADQSRPATSEEIRAVAVKVRRESESTVTQTTRASTGKLAAPSARAKNNPAYRNPLASATSAQKRLPATTNYVLDDSPDELEPPKSHWAGPRPEFSPLKKQGKKAKRGAATGVGEEGEHRGSEDGEAQRGTQAGDSQYRDLFPDAVTRRVQHELEAAAGAGAADEDGEEITVGNAGTDAVEDDDAASKDDTTQRAKGGRPKKASTESENAPKAKRKRGRPKKAIAVLVEPEEPEEPEEQEEPEEPEQPTAAVSGVRRSPRKKAPEDVAMNPSPAKSPATRSTQSKQRSKKRPSAVESLRKRRSLTDPDYQPANEGAEEVSEDEDQDARELFAAPEVRRIRPSELYPRDEEDGSPQPSPSSNTQKRKAGAQANTARKRARFGAPPQQDEPAEDAENSAATDERRVFGQWQRFKEVLKRSDLIGCKVTDNVPGDREDIPLRDADVKVIVELCKKAIRQYVALKTHNGPIEPEQDPVGTLIEINDRVEGLRDKNDEFPTDWNDETKSTNIYSHLFQKLVRLVKASMLCYEAMDAATSDGQISISHLRIVHGLIEIILDLEKSARKYKRPPTEYHVVQPVKEMIPLLRQIRHAFARQIYNHELAQQTARREEQHRLACIAREEEGTRRAQQETLARKFRDKWQKLHYERMLAEGGLMPNAKRIHLQLPDQYHIETDGNGIPFEREEVFGPRVGPPPDLVEAASFRQWSLVELSALRDGLKDYAGVSVYERIFWKYCKPRGELNRFSVTEIVVRAAALKEFLTQYQMRKFGDVEGWVLAVPVWCKASQGAGLQENEGGNGDGDYMMSGAV